MIAWEAKYHTQCLVTLYNKARKVVASDEREVDSDLGGCLEDLVSVQDNSSTPVVQVVILDGATIVYSTWKMLWNKGMARYPFA